VTIYQLCSGSLPYKGSTTALYNQIVGAPLKLDCLANAPSGLQEILTRMLSFDPEVRPTAEETAVALGRIMADSDGSRVSVNRRDEETMICQVFQAARSPETAINAATPMDSLASDQEGSLGNRIPVAPPKDAPTIDFAYRLSIWLVAAAGFYFLAKEWPVAGWVAVGVLLAAGLAKLFLSGSGSAEQS
jgi:serine/threonine protein kinase